MRLQIINQIMLSNINSHFVTSERAWRDFQWENKIVGKHTVNNTPFSFLLIIIQMGLDFNSQVTFQSSSWMNQTLASTEYLTTLQFESLTPHADNSHSNKQAIQGTKAQLSSLLGHLLFHKLYQFLSSRSKYGERLQFMHDGENCKYQKTI